LPPEQAGEPDRFFFCHMQKTGGMSLYLRMQRQFGEKGIYPDAGDGDPHTVSPQIHLPVLMERWAARRDQIRAVTGHFPLCTTELLDAEFRTFTILRDPVERTLSYLRHHRKTTPADAELSLEEIYEDPGNFKHFIHDHMVKMLSVRADELIPTAMMTVVDLNTDHLRTAKSALEGMDAFGLQDELEGFAGRLERLFGWRLGPPVHVNVTEHDEVPASFRKRIAKDNRLDMDLFEHARKLLGR
jgi:hypothetical protein